jgi:hypothetical protein
MLLCLGASASAASAGACSEPGYQAIWRNSKGVFMMKAKTSPVQSERVYVCAFSYGKHAKVGKFNTDIDIGLYGRFVLNSQTAAWAEATSDEGGDSYLDQMGKVDLATGTQTFARAVQADTYSGYKSTDDLRSVALAPNGSLAWMVDYKHKGKAKREIHLWDTNGARIVSTSLVATPVYLAHILGVPAKDVVFSKRHRGMWPTYSYDSQP